MAPNGDAFLGEYGSATGDPHPQTVMGTDFIAPVEQWSNSPYTSSVDVFTFGVLMFELDPKPKFKQFPGTNNPDSLIFSTNCQKYIDTAKQFVSLFLLFLHDSFFVESASFSIHHV